MSLGKYAPNLAIIAIIFLQSCVKDTCNNELGSTFYEVAPTTTEHPVTEPVIISLEMETLPELPAAYFESVLSGNDMTAAQIQSVNAQTDSLHLFMKAGVLPDSGTVLTYQLSLQFGDRQDYINCQHPGSADRYFLELTFDLDNPVNTHYELLNFSWNEVFLAGHL